MTDSEPPTDAFAYLKAVQEKTADEPHLFNEFLEVLRIFREESSCEMKTIATRIIQILGPFPDLVLGFNSFLPEGYEIEMQDKGYVVKDGTDEFLVDVVSSTPEIPTDLRSLSLVSPMASPVLQNIESPNSMLASDESSNSLGLSIQDALDFLAFVRLRAEETSKPSLYKKFKETMKKQLPLSKLLKQVQQVFKGYPELMEHFNKFLREECRIKLDTSVSSARTGYNHVDTSESDSRRSSKQPGESPDESTVNSLLSLVENPVQAMEKNP